MAETIKNPDSDDVRKDIEELRKDLASLGKDVRKLAREGAGDASRRATSTVEDLQNRAESALSSVAEQGRDAAKNVEGTVKSHPLESLLVAFGVGVLLGNIIRR